MIRLGNPKAVESLRPDDAKRLGVKGKEVGGFIRHPVKGEWTDITPADSNTVAATLADIGHLWPLVSDAEGPSWVSGDNEQLVKAVAAVYGCPIKKG